MRHRSRSVFRRLGAALAATALVIGLLGPRPLLAADLLVPICSDGSTSVDEDSAVNDSVSCLLTESGDTYQVDNNVNHGSLALDANDGSFHYTPDGDYFGSDSFDLPRRGPGRRLEHQDHLDHGGPGQRCAQLQQGSEPDRSRERWDDVSRLGNEPQRRAIERIEPDVVVQRLQQQHQPVLDAA